MHFLRTEKNGRGIIFGEERRIFLRNDPVLQETTIESQSIPENPEMQERQEKLLFEETAFNAVWSTRQQIEDAIGGYPVTKMEKGIGAGGVGVGGVGGVGSGYFLDFGVTGGLITGGTLAAGGLYYGARRIRNKEISRYEEKENIILESVRKNNIKQVENIIQSYEKKDVSTSPVAKKMHSIFLLEQATQRLEITLQEEKLQKKQLQAMYEHNSNRITKVTRFITKKIFGKERFTPWAKVEKRIDFANERVKELKALQKKKEKEIQEEKAPYDASVHMLAGAFFRGDTDTLEQKSAEEIEKLRNQVENMPLEGRGKKQHLLKALDILQSREGSEIQRASKEIADEKSAIEESEKNKRAIQLFIERALDGKIHPGDIFSEFNWKEEEWALPKQEIPQTLTVTQIPQGLQNIVLEDNNNRIFAFNLQNGIIYLNGQPVSALRSLGQFPKTFRPAENMANQDESEPERRSISDEASALCEEWETGNMWTKGKKEKEIMKKVLRFNENSSATRGGKVKTVEMGDNQIFLEVIQDQHGNKFFAIQEGIPFEYSEKMYNESDKKAANTFLEKELEESTAEEGFDEKREEEVEENNDFHLDNLGKEEKNIFLQWTKPKIDLDFQKMLADTISLNKKSQNTEGKIIHICSTSHTFKGNKVQLVVVRSEDNSIFFGIQPKTIENKIGERYSAARKKESLERLQKMQNKDKTDEPIVTQEERDVLLAPLPNEDEVIPDLDDRIFHPNELKEQTGSFDIYQQCIGEMEMEEPRLTLNEIIKTNNVNKEKTGTVVNVKDSIFYQITGDEKECMKLVVIKNTNGSYSFALFRPNYKVSLGDVCDAKNKKGHMNVVKAIINAQEEIKVNQTQPQSSNPENTDIKNNNATPDNLNTKSKEKIDKRNNPETEKVFIKSVNNIGRGVFNISLPKAFSPMKNAGFQFLQDQEYQETKLRDEELMEKIQGQRAAEGVSIRPLTITETHQPEKKTEGLLSFLEQKPKPTTTTRAKNFSESVESSKKNEPAYLLTYIFNPCDNMDIRDSGGGYQDYSNRYGQQLMVKMVLPESMMKFVRGKIHHPAGKRFLRKLAKSRLEKGFKDNSIQIDFEKAWNEGKGNNGHPLKPPYEAWDNSGARMVIVDKTEKK